MDASNSYHQDVQSDQDVESFYVKMHGISEKNKIAIEEMY